MAGSKNKTTVLAEISLILATVFWGLNFAATKYYGAESIPPLVFMALRFAGGGLLLILILRAFEPARAGSSEGTFSPWRLLGASG